MFQTPLFTNFLKLSNFMTLLSLGLLIISFFIIYLIEKKKINFSIRMIVALILGVSLGILIQAIGGFPTAQQIKSTLWIQQTITWYTFFGSAFVSFIRMLVIPVVLISMIQVIITLKDDLNISSLVRKTLFWLMFTTGIAAIVGIILSLITNLGDNMMIVESERTYRAVIDLPKILIDLIPANPIKSMVNDNIISVVIFASFIGSSARIMRSKEKYKPVMDIFANVIDASYRVVMSMAMTIVRFMPYGVIALMSQTIISYGFVAIQQALLFIILIYVSSLIMMIIYCVLLLTHGLNPITFFRKTLPALLMAFSSRSSVGSLPVTISTLETNMGVNNGTANFVASLGSTMGMNGCAGYFPAMVAVMIATMTGTPIDASFIIMVIIVAVIGSLGIAGIPGSATMAASIMLAGIGMSEYFSFLAIVLAIDPIIDMARTMINVNGAMVSAVCIDKELGTLDIVAYNDMTTKMIDDENL